MINKKPLINFLFWLFGLLLLILVGITNVFADTYDATKYTAQLYDNYGPSLSSVSTSFTNNSWRGTIPTMVANSAGGAWGVSSPIVLLSNHTYSLSARIDGTYGGRIALSSYNRIGVGTTLSNAVSSYTNNSYVNENYSRVLDDGQTIQFAFTPTTNGSFIVFPFSTTYGGSNFSFYLYDIIINDLGGGGVSQTDITNSLNNQTNNINSNSNNNRDIIIQNQNENTQIISDGLDNVSEQLGSCYKNLLNQNATFTTNNATTRHNGNTIILVSDGWGSAYIDIPLTKVGYYTVSFDNTLETGGYINIYYVTPAGVRTDWLAGGSGNSYSFYTDKSSGWLRVILGDTVNGSGTYTFWQLRLTNTQTKVPFSTYGIEQCSSKLDDTNNQLNDLNNNITDDDVDSSSWANFFNNFTTNTFGLTSIITAPLNLIQSLSSSTCTDLQIPLPYLSNKYLTLPCMSSIYSQYFGNFFTLYQTITFGIIAYWVCVRIFNLVKDFKNPEHDEIEVVDL